jgi:hypothetical protein
MNKPTTYTVTTPAPRMPTTPEEIFLVHPGVKPGNTDVLLCCIDRAQSIMTLLRSAGEEDESSLKHSIIINALWAIDGILDQMSMTIRGPSTSTSE